MAKFSTRIKQSLFFITAVLFIPTIIKLGVDNNISNRNSKNERIIVEQLSSGEVTKTDINVINRNNLWRELQTATEDKHTDVTSLGDFQATSQIYESKNIVHKPTIPFSKITHMDIKLPNVSNTTFRNLVFLYSSENLDTYKRKVAAFALSKFTAPVHNNYSNEIPTIPFICRSNTHKHTLATLFTTMYNAAHKFVAFNNTLHIWSSLGPDVRKILFVTPNVTEYENRTFYLVNRACELGWQVAIAPSTDNESYPLIKSMFQASYDIWLSDWYGYVNGDILFDTSLLEALHKLREYRTTMKKYTLLVGRRHDAVTYENDTLNMVKERFVTSQLHPDYAVDYFLTPRYGFPWHMVPSIVIGRPEVDNFLLWLARTLENVTDIDTTDAILALHQGMDGWKSLNRPTSHNKLAIKDAGLNISGQVYSRAQGCTECMNYKLGHMRTPSLLLYQRYMLVRGIDGPNPCKAILKNSTKVEVCCTTKNVIVKRDPPAGTTNKKQYDMSRTRNNM